MKSLTRTLLSSALLLTLVACQTVPAQQSEEINQVDQLVRLAERTAQSGDSDNAIGFYQKALAIEPDNEAALRAVGNLLMRSGNTLGMEKLYEQGVAAGSKNPNVIRGYANALLMNGKTTQAMIQFKRGLTIAPKDVKLINGLGISNDMVNEHSIAQEFYDMALELDPDDLQTKNNAALSYIFSDKLDEALAILQPYENDVTAPARVRLNLALAYGLMGETEKARAVASQILDAKAVENNLKAYDAMRTMSAEERVKIIMR